MAPLLDTNHELNWHANMVDAIEQKAANQRAEGQCAPSTPAISALLHLEGYHHVCVDVHRVETCVRHVIGGMLNTVSCLPLTCFVFNQSTGQLMHHTVDILLYQLRTVWKLDSQYGKTTDAFRLQFAQPAWSF